MYRANGYEAPTIKQLVSSISGDVTEYHNLPNLDEVYYNYGHRDHFFTPAGVRAVESECEHQVKANRTEMYLSGLISWNEV